MLEDPKMFNVPSERIGQVSSDLTIYSLPFSMVSTFFVSYIFEIFGRKITLFMTFFLTSIIYFFVPYTAPSLNLLIVLRILIGVTMSAALSHPLIPDYVKASSRGKAVAFAGLGLVIGEVFSIGVLFTLTKSLNFYDAFAIASFLIFLWSIYLLLQIKDPNIEKIMDHNKRRIDLISDAGHD